MRPPSPMSGLERRTRGCIRSILLYTHSAFIKSCIALQPTDVRWDVGQCIQIERAYKLSWSTGSVMPSPDHSSSNSGHESRVLDARLWLNILFCLTQNSHKLKLSFEIYFVLTPCTLYIIRNMGGTLGNSQYLFDHPFLAVFASCFITIDFYDIASPTCTSIYNYNKLGLLFMCLPVLAAQRREPLKLTWTLTDKR